MSKESGKEKGKKREEASGAVRKKTRREQKSSNQETSCQALLEAVRGERLPEVLSCLSDGGDLKVVFPADTRNVTWCLLTLAANRGYSDIVEVLIQVNTSVEGYGSDDRTPLMHAARNGHRKTVKILLDNGAEPLARDKAGNTALHGAAQKGRLECASLLLERIPCATVNADLATPVHSASFGGHVSVIKKLESTNWNMRAKDEYGRTALHWAAQNGSLEAVDYLVHKSRLKPTEQCNIGLTPLEYAVMFGKHETERALMAHTGQILQDNESILRLMRRRMAYDEDCYKQLVKNIDGGLTDVEGTYYDLHMRDKEGLTLLHHAARRGISSAVEKLLSFGTYSHVVSLSGHTPSCLADERGFSDVCRILEEHRCPKSNNSQDLYEEMLQLIKSGDDVRKVSKLLSQGCPLHPENGSQQSALQMSVNNDRPRIVSLLVAAGASLTPCISGHNLLQQAWYSANATPALLCSLTKAFSIQLQEEKRRLMSASSDKICTEIDCIVAKLEGDRPWEASWSPDDPVNLTSVMADAARANCPTTATFLHQAGAWCYFSGGHTSPLHAALKAHHWDLAETFVRDFGGCIHIPDEDKISPVDMMPEQYRNKIEQMMYQRDLQKLDSLSRSEKDPAKKWEVESVKRLKEQLLRDHQRPECTTLIFVVRHGLLYFTHLLLESGDLMVSEKLDTSSGSTALHEAASHGKSACGALLMAAGADPLRPDKYGQTPLHLAAMFGHTDTFCLLDQHIHTNTDSLCRANTTAYQVKDNYEVYVQCYRKCGDAARDSLTMMDRREENQIFKRILRSIKTEDLLCAAQRAKLDFSQGEAKQVKEVVEREVGEIIERACTAFKAELRLVGSTHDGSKLYAPDEFDFNLKISLPASDISVFVQENEHKENSRNTEPELNLKVESNIDILRNTRVTSVLYDGIQGYLDDHTLQDKRLSVVPPGLTTTKVGVALAMAWQGEQYPLLLVSADLVPVLSVPWNHKIHKPYLTPPGTCNMHISNVADGSWRCSFAEIETEVLKSLQPDERQVYLASKTLLSCLTTEPWMPQELKAFRTWWCTRPWKIPVPKVFCLKNSFFELLERKQKAEEQWVDDEVLKNVQKVFRNMCSETDHKPILKYAYFGGKCETPTKSIGADTILTCFQWE